MPFNLLAALAIAWKPRAVFLRARVRESSQLARGQANNHNLLTFPQLARNWLDACQQFRMEDSLYDRFECPDLGNSAP